jgi:hypothetical protein
MTPTVPASRGRASLLVMGLAAFMVQADARVIDPLLHVVAHDFHTTPPAAAIVISSYALPYGLFQLLYGPIGDRVGKLRVMAACLALFSIGTFGCAFVPDIPVFAVLRFLTGVVAAAVIPMSLGYIGDKFPYEGRQIALGRFMSALMLGQIVGSTVGGLFGQYLGWRNVFIALGVAAFAVSILLAREGRRFPETPGVSRRPGYLTLLKLPGSPLVLGTVMVEGLFVFGGLAYLASSLTDRFDINYAYAGLMVTRLRLRRPDLQRVRETPRHAHRRDGRPRPRRLAARRRIRLDRRDAVVALVHPRRHRRRHGLLHDARHAADARDGAVADSPRRGDLALRVFLFSRPGDRAAAARRRRQIARLRIRVHRRGRRALPDGVRVAPAVRTHVLACSADRIPLNTACHDDEGS